MILEGLYLEGLIHGGAYIWNFTVFTRQVVNCELRWVIVVVYLLCIYSLFCFLCKVWENIVQNLERNCILLSLRLHFSIFTD